ncbi:MAG: hypothetical protein WCC06_10865 [Candidatus Aminicenantales bacterium]
MRYMRAVLICILGAVVVFGCKGEKVQNKETPNPAMDQGDLKPEFPFRGRIVFQSNMDGDNEIYLMTKDGLKKLTDNTWSDEYPKWSPDRTKIAFTANPKGKYEIFVMNADGSDLIQIIGTKNDAIEHAWFPDGEKIAFTEEFRSGLLTRFVLWQFDLKTKNMEKMIPEFPGYTALPDFSPSAPLMGFTGKKMIGWDVFLFDLEKKEYKSLTKGGKSCRPHFSRDGEKIAYVSAEADGKGDIWLMNPDGSNKERLTERDATYDYFPSWSSDGKYIVFCSSTSGSPREGRWSLFLVQTGTQKIISLFASGSRDLFPDWD